MSRPKTLAERLLWMAENLPGFAAEVERVRQIEIAAVHAKAPGLINATRSRVALANSTSIQTGS